MVFKMSITLWCATMFYSKMIAPCLPDCFEILGNDTALLISPNNYNHLEQNKIKVWIEQNIQLAAKNNNHNFIQQS